MEPSAGPPVPDAPWLDAAADVVTVSGPDALAYLQSQLSQELRDLPVGGRRWTLVLEPTGKVDVLARLTRSADDRFVLETDAGFGQLLLDRLDRFKIRVKVETVLDVAPPSTLDLEIEAARVSAGWPRMGAEIVPGETIPAETGVVPVAVDFRKGCYPGQELVERMDSRGAAAPRSLRWLTVEPGTSAGSPVVDADGEVVGTVTSVSGTTALAYVKRSSDVGTPIVHPTPVDGVRHAAGGPAAG